MNRSDIRQDARIVLMATRLAARPNKPQWIKPYDPLKAILVIRQYRLRQEMRYPVHSTESTSRYQEYLRSRDWYDFRLAIMALGGGLCVRCTDSADDVHHLHYRTLGNESPCDVEPLCRNCHSQQHPNAMKFSC